MTHTGYNIWSRKCQLVCVQRKHFLLHVHHESSVFKNRLLDQFPEGGIKINMTLKENMRTMNEGKLKSKMRTSYYDIFKCEVQDL